MQAPNVKTLVLDSGPLLSLVPLRGLSEHYLTVPQVLDELKDKRAREHFERLALTAGVHIEIRKPDAIALAKGKFAMECNCGRISLVLLLVIEFAKKTGDYAVLSSTDLCVLALTYAVAEEAKLLQERESKAEVSSIADLNGNKKTRDTSKLPRLQKKNEPGPHFCRQAYQEPVEVLIDTLGSTHLDAAVPSSQTLHSATPMAGSSSHIDANDPPSTHKGSSSGTDNDPARLLDDPHSEEDDGEGEWITASNVALYKSRALDLLPAEECSSRTRRGNRHKG